MDIFTEANEGNDGPQLVGRDSVEPRRQRLVYLVYYDLYSGASPQAFNDMRRRRCCE